jgi:hypothetical protein
MDFEPGPELDAEIVRRVFGGDSFPSQAIPGRWVWYRSGALDIVPPYSTDIAAAWQVVEELQRRGWNPTLWYENDTWHAQLDHPGIGFCDTDCRGDTIQLAICRAAIHSLGSIPTK